MSDTQFEAMRALAEERGPIAADELAALRERCEAATEGPWLVGTADRRTLYAGPETVLCGAGQSLRIFATLNYHYWRAEDSAFVAHARTDMPRLIREVERLTAERDAFARLSMVAMVLVRPGDAPDDAGLAEILAESRKQDGGSIAADELAALKGLCEAAPAGPVHAMLATPSGRIPIVAEPDEDGESELFAMVDGAVNRDREHDPARTRARAEYVASAIVLAPRLIAEVDRLRARVAELERERDAVIGSLIAKNEVYYDVLIPKPNPGGVYKLYAMTTCFADHAAAISAVRKAAGLEAT